MRAEFGVSWLGIRRDENYTYFADGTKERSNETTVVWDDVYRPDRKCASTSRFGVVKALLCQKEYELLGICEKSVCKN